LLDILSTRKCANNSWLGLCCCPGPGDWLLIDFGLARRYTCEAGEHMTERSDAAFRGSTTYASVNSLKAQDLSRRDDLWSWLYMLVELSEGG
jgi:tau tubulin kinase